MSVSDVVYFTVLGFMQKLPDRTAAPHENRAGRRCCDHRGRRLL